MRFVTAVCLLVVMNSPLFGQRVGDRRFDPVTGDYHVWVMDDSLQLIEMRVVPPNKVLASVATMIQPGRLRPLRYTYAVQVLEGTRQPLIFVEIDCPASIRMEGLSAVAVHKGVRQPWNIEQVGKAGSTVLRHRCDGMSRDSLPAGGTLDVRLETTLLPVIGEVRLFGATGGFSWPTFDPIEENEPARLLIDSLDGGSGGWKAVAAPVPGRDPATVTSVAQGILMIRSDLDRACGGLRWISSAAVCGRLRKNLEQATLRGFLAELAGQHNSTGNSPINDAAFWLLKVNAEFVLGLIPRPSR
jgi:hypothetical protein